VQGFTAADATVIVGTVIDDSLGEDLRVTLVATGIGRPSVGVARRDESRIRLVRNGTDDTPLMAENDESDAPAVIRRRDRKAQVDALKSTGLDDLDIPAFLRRQVD